MELRLSPECILTLLLGASKFRYCVFDERLLFLLNLLFVFFSRSLFNGRSSECCNKA